MDPLDTTRHWSYRNYNYVTGKTDGSCVHGLFQDSKNNRSILICYPRTLSLIDNRSFYDSIKFENLSPNQYLEFGTIDNSDSTTSFIIAIEKHYNVNKTRPSNSLKIYKAWTYDLKAKRYQELNAKKLYRINEGYYKK